MVGADDAQARGANPSWEPAAATPPMTSRWDGGRFHNRSGPEPHGLPAVLRWMWTRTKGPWPKTIAQPPVAPPPRRRDPDEGAIHATLIGHATVLVQVAGLTILTDPVWSQRIGPASWLGIKRVRPPAFALRDCPPIDVILVSHNHYDHLDRPTLAFLATRDAPLILTGLRGGHTIPASGVVELDWWSSYHLARGVTITYVPAQHFSGRGLFDRNTSLWGGFVLETPAGMIYFAGDTGFGPHFAAIRARFGPAALALLPIGAFAPRWFMARVHVDPQQAVAASLILEAQVSLAIHYGTFPLADDGMDAPVQELATALASIPAATRGGDIRTPAWGEDVVVRPSPVAH